MRPRKIAGIVIANAVIFVIVFEVAVRLAAPILPGMPGAAARWVTTGQPYAEAWIPAWQQNRDHFYALRPSIDDELQYGSATVSFRLSTIELWEGGGIGFRTDPVNFFVDVVVVGDSFSFCFTERADCWVDQLAAQTGLGIVNLSQPVTGTTSHLRILRDFGAPLTPPLIIWQFFGNDFNEDYGLAVFRNEIDAIDVEADEADNDTSPLAWLQSNSAALAVLETLMTGRFSGVPAGEREFVKPHRVTYGVDNQHVLQFGGLYEQEALDMSRPENQIGLELSRESFAEAQALVAGWDGEIVVVMIPTREEVYAHLTAPVMGQDAIDALASSRIAMHDLCRESGLRCYDPTPALTERARAGEALYYTDDMHLNPHGNAVLAELVASWLIDGDDS